MNKGKNEQRRRRIINDEQLTLNWGRVHQKHSRWKTFGKLVAVLPRDLAHQKQVIAEDKISLLFLLSFLENLHSPLQHELAGWL